MKKINLIVATALAVNVFATSIIYAQSVRDYPTIAAGYAPYPMAVAVSEQLTQSGKLKKAPNIQSTSPELAYKQFCASDGIESLDAAVVLRPMTADEQELCANNDVKDILKFKTGVTAVVIAFTGNIKDLSLIHI